MFKRSVLAAFSAFLLSTGFAAAATCNLSYVSGASMCEFGDTNNDKVGGNQPLYVNQHEIFGMDTWSFLGKDEDGDVDGNYSIGTDYDYYMLVLKGPNNTGLPYIAYKVAPGSSGTYNTTAFNGQDVSHVSYYGKNGDGPPPPNPVPLPAAGFLLLAGLGGLAVMRRKR